MFTTPVNNRPQPKQQKTSLFEAARVFVHPVAKPHPYDSQSTIAIIMDKLNKPNIIKRGN